MHKILRKVVSPNGDHSRSVSATETVPPCDLQTADMPPPTLHPRIRMFLRASEADFRLTNAECAASGVTIEFSYEFTSCLVFHTLCPKLGANCHNA